ncbi:MAG: phenylalanine--tRNA ligase subunit beta [Taibaiella sp.]|nr:phenylalanine--tRNA ligase subunit beta [Taibaiella sp.]
MIISYQWLSAYLPVPVPVNELSTILTSIGLEVEAVERVDAIPGGLQGLMIGEVLTCDRHPNADKLNITTVNVGAGAPLKIVCGAPNVAAGQKVVVAPVGATVHPTKGEPFLIKKAKIRGEESEGMICAEDEIGIGESHAGIMILPDTAVPGTLAKVFFNIPETDYSIHIGLTPNRSDANSHIGVARDVCAYLAHHKGSSYHIKLPVVTATEVTQPSPVTVSVEEPAACRRYAATSLAGVTVGDSPDWLKQRLQAIGVRSINNIVDVTNFVLHEYGQPLHAFDADKIAGNQIIVRFMPADTVFMGLDEKERKLGPQDIIICDGAGPLAMGGVFGGLHSGISAGTTNIFLESANFEQMHIRRTSLHHGLRTDAATHFEKGVDINNVIPALQRAAALITEVAGGQIVSAITDVYPSPLQPVTVHVAFNYIEKLSGKKYGRLVICEMLVGLGFIILEENEHGLTLQVPGNKTDVTQPADIVEEILRIDGLDNVALTGRLNIALTKATPNDRQLKERMSELLCGMGAQEIVTNSIVNSKYYPGNANLVRMINSLSSELDVMRPSMTESGLEVIQYNCNRKSQDLCLFEFGNIYYKGGEKYIQESRLGIWLTGNVHTGQWNQQAKKADIYYLKGIVANLLLHSNITTAQVSYPEGGNEQEAVWKWKNQVLCTVSKIAAPRLKEFDVKQDVYYADVCWDVWVKAQAAGKVKYTEVPKFPAVARDLAIVLDKAVTYRQVQDATAQLKLNGLQSFGLFDIFESEKLGADKKSFALNYTFQLTDRTLTDTEIEVLMKQLVNTYTSKLSAQIR